MAGPEQYCTGLFCEPGWFVTLSDSVSANLRVPRLSADSLRLCTSRFLSIGLFYPTRLMYGRHKRPSDTDATTRRHRHRLSTIFITMKSYSVASLGAIIGQADNVMLNVMQSVSAHPNTCVSERRID